jgi:hypothetical protein
MSQSIRANLRILTDSDAALQHPPFSSSRPATPHPLQVSSYMGVLMDQSPAASHPVTQPSSVQQPHLWSMPLSSVAASSGGFQSAYEQLPPRLLQATVPPHPPPPPQVPIPSCTYFDTLPQYGSEDQPATAPFHGHSSSHPLMPPGFLPVAPQNEQQQQAHAMNYLLQMPPHQLQQLTAQQQQLQPHHPVGLQAPHYSSES